MFLLRANGDIAFMNRAAEALEKEQTIVRVASGRLAAADAAADRRLRQAIAANAQPGGDTGGEDGADTRSVVLPSRTGDAQVAHVLPLNIGGRYAFPGAGQAAVAVFVRDPARPMPVFGEAESPSKVQVNRVPLYLPATISPGPCQRPWISL